jgi:hypothetical protein
LKINPMAACPCCALRGQYFLPILSGVGADAPITPSEPPPSFLDKSPKEATHHVTAGDGNTRDLFEDVPGDRWVVIRGATVLTMDAPGVLAAHDVLISDGRVRDLRPTGGPLPDDAVIVEGSGHHLIPGLTDSHTHPNVYHLSATMAPLLGAGVTAEDILLPYDLQMFLFLAGGISRSEVMAGTAEELALREEIRRGHVRGPDFRIGSPVIEGYPPMQSGSHAWNVGDAEGGRRAAREVAERGFDFAKPYSRLSSDAYAALASECRALGVEMLGHIPHAVGAESAFAQGQTGVAHVFEFFCALPEPQRHDPDLYARLARLAASQGVKVQTTLVAAWMLEYDGGFVDDVRARQWFDPLYNYLMRPESPMMQWFRTDPSIRALCVDTGSLSVKMLKALRAEGVRLLPGTDGGNGNLTQGYSIHEELRLLVEQVGMAPLEVLRAATRDCAEHMGDGSRTGRIAPGFASDLVLLSDDPLADIRNTTKIETVIKGRSILRRDGRARGIDRVRARYAAMPIPAVPE